MVNAIDKNTARKKRHKRVRAKISGSAQRPRLCVYRSSKNIYAQLIDDEANDGKGATLAAASTLEKDFASEYGGNKVAAAKIGALIAKRGKEKGVEEVVFDRAGYLYHGRVAELANAAREGGLKF